MHTTVGERAPAVAMFEHDRASAALGMRLVAAQPGFAVVAMTVREDFLNGFDVLHGGLLFALADTAFAMACNETPAVTLAAGADITFLKPVTVGTELVATARRTVCAGRSGVYDVEVVDGDEEPVALFRGRSRTTSRPRPVGA